MTTSMPTVAKWNRALKSIFSYVCCTSQRQTNTANRRTERRYRSLVSHTTTDANRLSADSFRCSVHNQCDQLIIIMHFTFGHGLSINQIKSELHKNTFINRLIFDDCYRFLLTLFVLCFTLFVCFISLYVFIFVLLIFYVLTSFHAFDVITLYILINRLNKIISRFAFHGLWSPPCIE